MRSRSSPAPTPTPVEETPDSVSELTFHLGLRPPDDVPPGHEHQIETLLLGTLETTKTLSQETTGTIARDGVAHLSAHGQADAVLRAPVGQGQQHEEPPAHAPALLEDTIKLRAGPQAPLALEPHDLPGPCAIRRPASSDPSAAGASRPGAHPSCACGPGTHGSASASDYWAETSSSCCSPSVVAIPRQGAHQDKLKSVAEEGISCQNRAGSPPCTRARLYASLERLQTANTQSPSMTPGPAFPQLLKSLCKSGRSVSDASLCRVLLVSY